ncbi:putative bifunctional diguanylate cyclase/phosphodiesterase [Sanguibacter antarcticus]|uniref:Diguanylate cyclase (GGDEF)-like protein n=1 Tax=Sanguibacter antarcticus TaxID=372484 RepID=A0A2A9E377_9MICO|nr:EAL domain-containing protein [Sanguibacter antarcticus]PFG33106.1 diguanylate cyclase (GGDEF)-like protein [Sanguibacter antarcticus]
MYASTAIWTVMAQCVAAGLVAGLSILHTAWRTEEPRSRSRWTVLWSIALTIVFLTDALAAATPAGTIHHILTVIAATALAAALLLALPVAQSFAPGRSYRWYLVTASAFFLGYVVLLAARVVTPRSEPRADAYQVALNTATMLVPAAIVGIYLVLTILSSPRKRTRNALLATGALAVVLLVLSFVLPGPSLRSALTSAWLIPIIIALETLALRRIRHGQLDVELQSRMRDAQARVSNLAWYVKDPHALLRRAEDEARTILDDASVRGSIRTLSRGRFVTELAPSRSIADPTERKFLLALANIVSSAAERHALADRLSRAAFTDGLTGLPNRNALEDHLINALERANVERTRVGLFYADLDGFKRANDQYGHAWGDHLLVLAASHLRKTVGSDVFVARIGGDEFVVVVERAISDETLVALAQRIRDEFQAATTTRSIPRISVGVTSWDPGTPIEPDALLRCADTAMLEAKRKKSGVVFFDHKLESRVAAEARLRREIDIAVDQGDFCVHFQPIVDTTTLHVLGLEALARWEHDGKLRAPADWIDYAEDSGLIVNIGNMTFRQAFDATERFELPVAVNISARQLAEPSFLVDLTDAWGDRPWERLTIEITESALLHDSLQTASILAQLRERGARIALDDFGTGYNSLARLASLPIDILKIDQSFVRDIGSVAGRAVLQAIVTLATAHGLEIVAEGVERVDELRALVELGVTQAQGNMLGRPAAHLPMR